MRRRLLGMLACLTVMAVVAQGIMFYIHAHVATLVDSLAATTIVQQLMHPVILLALAQFLLLQLIAYGVAIFLIWQAALLVGALLQWSHRTTYVAGILLWFVTVIFVFTLNHAMYPHSFFAGWIEAFSLYSAISHVLLVLSSCIIGSVMLLAGYHVLRQLSWCYSVTFALLLVCFLGYGLFAGTKHPLPPSSSQPNIIIIGLDSLRPDFTGYFGNQSVSTPHIDAFLRSSAVFTNAYTPLARTFPSWVSILTAKYPKHHHGRVNMADPAPILTNEMLARRMQQAGYATLYATDEARFADINEQYGFDQVIRPKRGVVDFILGGLTDFPLTNLLVNLPGLHALFPYHHANRAYHITYQPAQFLAKVKQGIERRPHDKPVFLAIHLCLSHWPYLWANDGLATQYVPSQYKNSVAAVDVQFGELLSLLQDEGLLTHSLVVVLSDHGTTVGLPGDRLIKESNYMGKPEKMKRVAVARLSSAPEYSMDFKHDYTINTAYGQGNNVSSLKQYQVLLGFRGYGLTVVPHHVGLPVSLIDIAPTLLDYMHQPPMTKIDGISLRQALLGATVKASSSRPLYIETGDRVDGLETDNIDVHRVMKNAIHAYRVEAKTGALILTDAAFAAVNKNKQRAVIFGDWLLAYYPSEHVGKMVSPHQSGPVEIAMVPVPPYFILANIKTGKWTTEMTSRFANTAPVALMMSKLRSFYGSEMPVVRPSNFG